MTLERRLTESGLRPIEIALLLKANFFLLLLFFLAGGVKDGSVWWPVGGGLGFDMELHGRPKR